MTEMTMSSSAVRGRTTTRGWVAALPGLLFVIATLATVFSMNVPDDNASDRAWISYFADHGNRVLLLVNGYLLLAAGLLLIGFFVQLHRRVRATSDASGSTTLALVTGSAAGALVSLGGLISAALPGATIFGSTPIPHDRGLLQLTLNLGFVTSFVGGMAVAAVAIVALSREAQRSGYIGRKLAIAGYVAAAAGLAAATFLPIFVLLLWVIVVAVVMARRPMRG